jgi:hypothetical protein
VGYDYRSLSISCLAYADNVLLAGTFGRLDFPWWHVCVKKRPWRLAREGLPRSGDLDLGGVVPCDHDIHVHMCPEFPEGINFSRPQP